MVAFDQSQKMFAAATAVIPGGVNSPVRACKSVGAAPVFVDRGQGARIYDVDGNSYLDFISSWGPLIGGHTPSWLVEALEGVLQKGTSFGAPTENETKLAEKLGSIFPSLAMVRLVNSGTEAAMSAIRLARGFTGRDKIIKFQGCYHGHADSLLVAAGSGVATLGIPGCPGIPAGLAELTITLPYNNLAALTEALAIHGESVAAVIVEPVAGNMGVIVPEKEFLLGIQDLCRQSGALFICDEVITGCRLALGGAQEYFSLKPDLTVLGKIIGGGLPLAAFGGRRDVMETLAPVGGVYQAGTLSGNPLAVAAGLAMVDYLESNPGLYAQLQSLSQKWADGLLNLAEKHGIAACGNQIGSMSTFFFTEGPVYDYDSALKSDTALYGSFWRGMLQGGVWLAPSQFEASFTSAAMTSADIDEALGVAEQVFKGLRP